MEPYKNIERKIVFKGNVIDVVQDKVILPNGKESIREVVLHNGATAILPIDENGDIIFIKQYRHAIEREILELPAGCLEKNEDPKSCAYRELQEETGYIAKKLTLLGEIYTAAGFSKEIMHIFLAENLEKGEQSLDEDEFLSVKKYSLEEAINMIYTGKIVDAKTIIGIFYYRDILNNK